MKSWSSLGGRHCATPPRVSRDSCVSIRRVFKRQLPPRYLKAESASPLFPSSSHHPLPLAETTLCCMPGKRKSIDTEADPALQGSDHGAAKKRRVSSRLVTRKPVPLTEPDQNPLSDDGPRVRKRARRGPVVGRLAGLMELPMDILFEVRP